VNMKGKASALTITCRESFQKCPPLIVHRYK
jgi:hypothetical protein